MTYYEILQVLPTASPEVIRMAYKALASKYHPDVYLGNKAFAEMKMKNLNEAYAVLSSPASRQEYDRRLQQEKEEASRIHQTPPPPPKRDFDQKKKDRIIFLVTLLALAIPVGYTILDNVGVVSKKSTYDTNDKYQTVEAPAKDGTMVPATIIPRSGEILSGSECFDGSELTITASSNSSCIVKLKTASGVERLSFYVRSGDTVTVGVPAEYLYVYFASGETWYGRNLLFGDETYYSMDDELLDFTEYTWEYTLYPVNSGNFSETPIDPGDF